jgi:hypothetical protein
VTEEEAVEIVLQGAARNMVPCPCAGSINNFKGGLPVGTAAGYGPGGYVHMNTQLCTKCNGFGKRISNRYIEARALLGLPPLYS